MEDYIRIVYNTKDNIGIVSKDGLFFPNTAVKIKGRLEDIIQKLRIPESYTKDDVYYRIFKNNNMIGLIDFDPEYMYKEFSNGLVLISQHVFSLSRDYTEFEMRTFTKLDIILKRVTPSTYKLLGSGLCYEASVSDTGMTFDQDRKKENGGYFFINHPTSTTSIDLFQIGDTNISPGCYITFISDIGDILYTTEPITEHCVRFERDYESACNIYRTDKNEYIITTQDYDNFMGRSAIYLLEEISKDYIEKLGTYEDCTKAITKLYDGVLYVRFVIDNDIPDDEYDAVYNFTEMDDTDYVKTIQLPLKKFN